MFDDLERSAIAGTVGMGPSASLLARPPPSQSPRLDPKLLLQRLYAGTPIPSVDSAVESWDSLANLDTAGGIGTPTTGAVTAAATPVSSASPVSPTNMPQQPSEKQPSSNNSHLQTKSG